MESSGRESPPSAGSSLSVTNGDFKRRISRALKAFSSQLESLDFAGNLCQVWTPEGHSSTSTVSGTVVELGSQGRPFAVAGDADLLALFRYVSVAYKFSTDARRAEGQGAVGRVYSTQLPETCSDVQSLEIASYHRAAEAAKCNVNSMIVVPLWDSSIGARLDSPPVGVIELVMVDTCVNFEDILANLTTCMQAESFSTSLAEDLIDSSDRIRTASGKLPSVASDQRRFMSSAEAIMIESQRLKSSSGVSLELSSQEDQSSDLSLAGSLGSGSLRNDPRHEAEMLAVGLRALGKAVDKGQDDNRLVIGESIGHGAFGSVNKGRWRNLDVAVKTILFSDHGDGNNGSQQRAVMEAAVCSSVVHPNVVCTYHYDITPIKSADSLGHISSMQIVDEQQKSLPTDWKLYLVQELCQSTLRDALVNGLMHDQQASYQPFLDAILYILIDIALGMDYLHSKNIIHGDLKPENVLLKQDIGSALGVICKISDFGLCTSIDATRTHVSNFSNGTPFYAAPEVVSDGQATTKSDVYSFGVLMWVVYCRLPPWIKGSKGAYAWNDSFGMFPAPCPTAYMDLCLLCLQEDPKLRPHFCGVIEVLEGLLTTLKASIKRVKGKSAPHVAGVPVAAAAAAAAFGAAKEKRPGFAQQVIERQTQNEAGESFSTVYSV